MKKASRQERQLPLVGRSVLRTQPMQEEQDKPAREILESTKETSRPREMQQMVTRLTPRTRPQQARMAIKQMVQVTSRSANARTNLARRSRRLPSKQLPQLARQVKTQPLVSLRKAKRQLERKETEMHPLCRFSKWIVRLLTARSLKGRRQAPLRSVKHGQESELRQQERRKLAGKPTRKEGIQSKLQNTTEFARNECSQMRPCP